MARLVIWPFWLWASATCGPSPNAMGTSVIWSASSAHSVVRRPGAMLERRKLARARLEHHSLVKHAVMGPDEPFQTVADIGPGIDVDFLFHAGELRQAEILVSFSKTGRRCCRSPVSMVERTASRTWRERSSSSSSWIAAKAGNCGQHRGRRRIHGRCPALPTWR